MDNRKPQQKAPNQQQRPEERSHQGHPSNLGNRPQQPSGRATPAQPARKPGSNW